MMKILFDFSHPAHLNFFKNAISSINNRNNDIIVTYVQRGKLPKIVTSELPDIKKRQMGRHTGSKYSIIVEANILRFISFVFFFFKHCPDICLSVGSFTCGFAAKLFRIPNIQFDDDPERKVNVTLEKMTSDELYFPPIISENKRIKNFHALKEWAYLSPKYLNPNKNVLKKYGLIEREYIFIREVSTGSLNYKKQKIGIISSYADQLPHKYKVVFSLEDKSLRELYPPEWIDLKEPVDNLHSLIYYCKYLISSGDSMAREGAMLGIPSIYCGFREMKANILLEEKGILFSLEPDEVPSFINKLESGEQIFPTQETLRNKLASEWIDVTEFILNRIDYYRSK